MDYLSFLTLRLESCPQCPDFDRQDYMVLNSVANVSKALYPLGSYERIHCFFDNDRAGMEDLVRQMAMEQETFASHFGYFPVFIPSIGAERIAASKVSGNSSRYRTPMAPPME